LQQNGQCTRKAQETVNPSRNTPGSTQMNEVDYKTKAMRTTLIALLTLLLAATAPAQESIQNQLNQIEANQQALQGQIDMDQSNRWYAAFEAELEQEQAAQRQAEQAQARQLFKMCVDSGLTPAQCAQLWLH
jgi:hypothetical protein